MRPSRIAALLAVLACAWTLSAQKHPNIELGFNPDGLYHYTQLDSVNLFNGNLIIQIPIGGTYRANAAFQYQLTLVYNAKVWDYRREPDGGEDYVYSDPNWRSNAGVGWRLSLGRLLAPSITDSHYPGNAEPSWIYEGPSGDEHSFGGRDDLVLVTADQAHLRMVRDENDPNIRDIEFPNGEVHRFKKTLGRWNLRKISDRHGNSLEITPHFDSQERVTSWDLVDSIGRRHTVNFASPADLGLDDVSLETDDSVDRGQLVSSITVATLEDLSTTYDFEYEELAVMWGCGHRPHPNADDDLRAPTVTLPMLKRVVLPDNTAFSFNYYTSQGQDTGAGPCGQAMMQDMTVPTGGTTTYEYQIYRLPQSFCIVGTFAETNPGVKAKITPDGRWDYGLTLGKPLALTNQEAADFKEDCGNEFEVPGAPGPVVMLTPPRRWSRTTVLSPAVPFKTSAGYVDRRLRTDNYFYVWYETEPLLDEFSLPEDPFVASGLRFATIGQPFTSGAPADAGGDALCINTLEGCVSEDDDVPAVDSEGPKPRHLSTRMYEGCADNGSCGGGGSLLRSTYLRALDLVDPASLPVDHPPYDSTRTVFEDDQGCTGNVACWVQTESTSPDGAGHFKQEETTTNFPDGGGFTTVTNYLGLNGASATDRDTPWLLDIFTYKTRTENGATTKAEYCFDPSNGFLNGVRVLKEDTRSATDVLTTFESDSNGNVISEETYGGDVQGALSLESACETTASTPVHRVFNEYDHGRLRKSDYCDPEAEDDCTSILTTLDLTIDAGGTPTESRDAAGVPTQYAYYTDGRLKSVTPAGGPTSSYEYTPATATHNALVVEKIEANGSELLRSSFEFDGLGRLIRIRKSLPGGLFSVVDSEYDGLSRKNRVSQPYRSDGSAGDWSETIFDALGRPLEMIAPDTKKVTFSYAGSRKRTRSAEVATSLEGTTDATTTEYYDAQSRLKKVEEYAAGTSATVTTGGLVTTLYGYDAGGNLTSVSMSDGSTTQGPRLFEYDGRGFLKKETHPENGLTSYSGYDPRGHAGSRTNGEGTLAFTYDRAERLTGVSKKVGETLTLLKHFTFADHNDAGNKQQGKLVTAVRRNELPSAGTIDVTETYMYGGKVGGIFTGQLSSRKTLVERVNESDRTSIQEFEYKIDEYDALRLPKIVRMPTCSLHGCSASSGLETITYGRDAGFLTSVGDFGTLAYHPSGMVDTVTHATTPQAIDTYSVANGMARPSMITFGGGSCASLQTPVITVGAVCGNSAATASVPAVTGVTHAWSITGGTFTTSASGESVSFQASAQTVALTVTAANSCGQTTQHTETITVGGAPEPSPITASAGLCGGAGGSASVPAREGITHTWSIDGGTIHSGTTGNSITFHPAGAGLVVLHVTATSACGSAPSHRPVVVSSPPTATLSGSGVVVNGQAIQIPVDLSGVGPWSVTWSDGQTEPYPTTPGLHTVAPTEKTTYSVTVVRDAFGCAGTASGTFLVDVTAVTPQSVTSYQKYHSMYSPSHAATLWIDMAPAPIAKNSGEWHEYTFEWYEDDGVHPVRVLNGTAREIAVQPGGNAVYWAEITGRHGVDQTTLRQEVTVSPHMYVTLYGDCHMPALHVSQTHGTLDTGSTESIRFNAFVDWPNVEYQWYRGQSGDTRSPIDSDDGKPGQLTRPPHQIRPYWVRASLECGAVQDSASLIYTVGECGPVLIDQDIASQTVAFGGNTSLHVDLVNVPAPEFTWFEGEGELTQALAGSQQTLALTNVRKSGRYWVRVRNSECNVSAPADSFLATVRVSSCATITPPAQWQTEFWADMNGPATLSVSAGGATGYQWFKGEVGDESQLIGGAVQSSYVTANLTQESKYWVRVYGSSSCVVDSPTLIVRICEPPHLTGSAFNTNQNIVPGQWAAFTIPMAGTALQYRWYQGAPGDTSTPVGRTVDKLMVHPTETTSYWVDVWAPCGPNGNDQRHYAPSPVFTASVCPAPYQEPTTAKTTVMPGTTTTLSIGSPGAGYTYQWYIGDPAAGTSTPMGAPTSASSVTTPPINQTTTFWVAITSGGCMVPSAGVTVAVCPSLPLQIMVSHPNVGPGYFQGLTLSGVPADTALLYQWYQGPAGNTSTPISSQAAAGVSPMVTTSYWVRVTMTDTNCYADSPVVTINVCAPSITTQPVASSTIDKDSNPSASVHLTVGADITTGVTYQWYIGQPGNTSNAIAGATASSYDASPSATTTYWVRVTGTCSTYANSAAATVNVCHAPSFSPMGGTRYIRQGESVPIAVMATGTSLTYKWYSGASGNTSNPVANGTTASIVVSPTSTTTYWAQVKSEGLCSANSPTVTVDVCTAPSFTTQPQSRLSFAGNPVPLTALATSSTGPVSYQWYQGFTGDASAPISGATSPGLTVSPNAETSYWVRATTSLCSTDSTTATIAMCIYPEVITPSTSEKYIGYGATATLQLPPLSPVDNIGVTWYRGASGDRANLVASALNLTSYTTPALTSTTQYWAEITHNTCVSRTTSYTVSVCVSAITSQPTGGIIQSGQSKTLTVGTTAISGQTIQWYTGTAGNMTAPVAGAISASLTVSPTATTTYWVRVTGPCGPPVNSTVATVTVCTPPVISNTSANPAAIQLGSSTTLSVSASAVNKTYQWYVGPSGTTSSPVAYGTGGSINVAPGSTTTYWVQVKSEGFCTTNSPAVTVDVCTTPVITTQPQSQTIRIGQPATLTVATSTSGATVQWYQGAPGTTTTPLGTAAGINVTPSADTQYWARVTKGACSIDSNGATITVCALTVSMPNVNAASGQNATLTATVTNARAAVTYMWYRGNAGDTTNPVGGSSVPQITVNRTANTNYWVRVTDGTCTLDSTTATLFICVPTITTQPQSATIISGQSTTLSVAATGSPLTYQWYAGDSGVTTSPISGATSSSYTTPALTTLSKYWARVTGCSVANSATATVTVCIAPSTPSTPTKSGVVNPGNAAWVSISASGTGLTYQWYKGQSGDTSRPISGATSATYNFTLSVSEYFWVRVSGTCGTPANSAAILYSVTPAITVQPQSPSIPSGSSTSLSVTATGNFLTYQWFNASMQPITGATSPAYTTPAITSETTFYVRVYSGALTANANPATVTICTGPGVGMTYAQHSTHSYTLIVSVDEADAGNVKFQWYTGTPGNVAQSTPQGPISGQSQWYLGNVTQPTTWWVRAWYIDDHCYSDTYGVTVN